MDHRADAAEEYNEAFVETGELESLLTKCLTHCEHDFSTIVFGTVTPKHNHI